MISAREFGRRNLSPGTFRGVRFGWWLVRSHLGGLASPFRSQTFPHLSTTPRDEPSEFFRKLRGINVFSPTHMCRVMARHGSDKASFHNYTTVYSVLFRELREKPLRILEVGLGTNNSEVASSMGTTGKPGASVRGWRELFPRALIYGADIDRTILFREDRIETFYCDQLDATAVRDLWSQPQFKEGIDIIIDDGLHTFEANMSLLTGSLQHLRPGGIYVVEDIRKDSLSHWSELLHSDALWQYPNYEFALLELPHRFNKSDNNMFLVHRNG